MMLRHTVFGVMAGAVLVSGCAFIGPRSLDATRPLYG